MKPAPFEYFRAATVAEAVEALGADESSRVLAGGQSLIPTMNFRLTDISVLVDIGRIDGLDGVVTDDDGVRVGATATQSQVLGNRDAVRAVPGLGAALRQVGHLQVRNRGTVCGSIAHADPAAELPALAVATDAVIGVAGPNGQRRVAASEFFLGPFWTALADDELITDVQFPTSGAGSVTVVDEISRRAGDFAIVGLAALIDMSGDSDNGVGTSTGTGNDADLRNDSDNGTGSDMSTGSGSGAGAGIGMSTGSDAGNDADMSTGIGVGNGAGAVRSARLVGFGVGGKPARLATAEAVLSGWTAGRFDRAQPDSELIDAVMTDAAAAFDDIHATGLYRREALAALVVRAARGALRSPQLRSQEAR